MPSSLLKKNELLVKFLKNHSKLWHFNPTKKSKDQYVGKIITNFKDRQIFKNNRKNILTCC